MSKMRRELPESEKAFLKILWRKMVANVSEFQAYTNWTITGLAAIITVLLTNAESIAKMVNPQGLRWGLVFLILSLMFGVMCKIVEVMMVVGIKGLREMEQELSTTEAQEIISKIETEPDVFLDDIAQPFLWPISLIFKKHLKRGMKDDLAAEKYQIQNFCYRSYFGCAQHILAIFGFLTLAFSIHI